MRNTRPKGMSTHHRFPSRSNEGPSRKLSTWAPPRLGSDQLVRRFLRNFAGSEVKGRAWMRLIFWKGLCMGPGTVWETAAQQLRGYSNLGDPELWTARGGGCGDQRLEKD